MSLSKATSLMVFSIDTKWKLNSGWPFSLIFSLIEVILWWWFYFFISDNTGFMQRFDFNKEFSSVFFFFFSIKVFFYRHWRFTGHQGKGGDRLLFHSTTSTRSRTFRNLFATLHVRWLPRIFNRKACVYQAAIRWDLPPYQITIRLIDWLIDDAIFVRLLDDLVLDFCYAIWRGEPMDLNSHRLSPLYYKRVD